MPDPNTPLLPVAQNLPARSYYTSAPQDYEPEPPGVPLTHYLWVLRRHFWKILVFVLTCLAVTFVISSRLVPIYESTAVVDVDRQAPSAVVGQESNRLTMLNDADQFLATQVKLIQSDAVLRPIAIKYDLLTREKQFSREQPGAARNAVRGTIQLKQLKVTRPPNTYLLLISYRSPDADLAAAVANEIAQSYLQHSYTIRIRSSASLSAFMEQQIEELRAKMEKSSLALAQFERELNVINPEEKTSILSARLLQLNIEYTGAQSERVRKEAAWNSMKSGSLEAAQVSNQGDALLRINEKLNEARQRFAEVKTTYGVNHPEFRKASSQLTEVLKQFEEARTNIAQRIETDYRQSQNREEMLNNAVAETKSEFDRVNARSFEYQQVKREAEADKKLYEELVRKIREAGINAGFQNNNVRIADLARPGTSPVFPNLRMNMMLAFLSSCLLGVGAAVLADALDTTVRNAEETSRFLGTDVIASLPAVRNMSFKILPAPAAKAEMALILTGPSASGSDKTPRRVKILRREGAVNGTGKHGKGYYRSISGFEEAIRTLRNTLLLRDLDTPLKSILVTSAAAKEGKSTMAVHLAIAHASQGKKTLLVDGDLRRPTVHRKLGLSGDVGLSSILTGESEWKPTVQKVESRPNLDVISSGPPSHRAADLIGPRMGDLIDEFAKEYDLVIVDSPPVLGFAEPLQMATGVDGVVVVSRAGETKRKAISALLSAMRRIRANVLGVVLNQVKSDTSDEYSYYGYYRPNYYRRAEE